VLKHSTPPRAAFLKPQTDGLEDAPQPGKQQTAKQLATRGPPATRGADWVVSLERAGEILSSHPATIRRLIKSGRLIAVRVADKKVGVRMSSIQAHMDANEIDPATFCA
jgi:hypothetical protein